MITALVALLLYLWFFLSAVFYGFRVGSLFTTIMLLAAGFLIVVFLCCRWLFKPTKKQQQAADYIISGLQEKRRDD